MKIRKLISALLLTATGLFFAQISQAQVLHPIEPYKGGWYNIPMVSKHTNTDTEHNERNWGFGIERYWIGRNWQIGAYRNSYWKSTGYIMTELTSYQIYDRLRFRFNGGLVSGYRYPITPMVLPVWTYDGGKWGFDLLTIPSVGGRMGIYALQMKVRF
jgi:hypothetical protein